MTAEQRQAIESLTTSMVNKIAPLPDPAAQGIGSEEPHASASRFARPSGRSSDSDETHSHRHPRQQACAVAGERSDPPSRRGRLPEPDPHDQDDRRQAPDVSLATIGGKGLFIKELEEALERGDVDIAVHSLKDVPSIIPGPVRAGRLPRAGRSARRVDSAAGTLIKELPAGSRHRNQRPAPPRAAHAAPGAVVETSIRGNVDTRISKVRRRPVRRNPSRQRRTDASRPRTARSRGTSTSTRCSRRLGRASSVSRSSRRTDARAKPPRPSTTCRALWPPIASAAFCRSSASGSTATPASRSTRRWRRLAKSRSAPFSPITKVRRPLRVTRSGSDADAVIDAVADELIANGAIELLGARS